MNRSCHCWHLYVIRTDDQSMYAGISTDVQRCFKEHIAQGRKTAKYLLAHKPQSLVLSLPIGDQALALKVEYHFKRLTKMEKEMVVDSQQLFFDRDSGKIRV